MHPVYILEYVDIRILEYIDTYGWLERMKLVATFMSGWAHSDFLYPDSLIWIHVLGDMQCQAAMLFPSGRRLRRKRGRSQHHCRFFFLLLIAFITGNSSLEPLIEGLCAQIHVNLR